MMRLARLLRSACLIGLAACSGPVPARLPAPPEAPLPPAPADHLVGDGHGVTERDAELDARRAVIEQLDARVESRTEAEESEHNGQGDRRSAVHVTSEARFDHAELLKTLAVVPGAEGFRARVVLSRRTASAALERDLVELDSRISGLTPTLTEGIAHLDTAILLATESAPATLLERRRGLTRVLRALGKPVAEASGTSPLQAQVAALRRQATIRLQVRGAGVGMGLRTAAVNALTAALRARGCVLVEGPFLPPAADTPAADATLVLALRSQQEGGLQWRTLGLDLRIVDARSGRPVLLLSGPRAAHAGGLSDQQADQAVIRRLESVLEDDFAPTLDRIQCR